MVLYLKICMKILILGSQGNLGHQLVKVFSEYEVIESGSSDLDITNSDLVFEKIKSINPDIIINAAAYNAVDKCEQAEKEFGVALCINGHAPGVLARAALSCGAVLVHYSTDYVFGGEEGEGYVEGSTPSPINKYGQTKLVGENNIFALEPSGLKYYIVRVSRLFGPQGTSLNSKQNFFDIILNKLREQESVNIVADEVASFSYTPDVARATKDLILNTKSVFGVYHLVNSGAASWHQSIVELVRILGLNQERIKEISGNSLPRPARRPKNSMLRNTKTKELRGWREALREYLTESKIN